jgi:hypothetical protein
VLLRQLAGGYRRTRLIERDTQVPPLIANRQKKKCSLSVEVLGHKALGVALLRMKRALIVVRNPTVKVVKRLQRVRMKRS